MHANSCDFELNVLPLLRVEEGRLFATSLNNLFRVPCGHVWLGKFVQSELRCLTIPQTHNLGRMLYALSANRHVILEGCENTHWSNPQVEQYVRKLCRKLSTNYVTVCVGKYTFQKRLTYIKYLLDTNNIVLVIGVETLE